MKIRTGFVSNSSSSSFVILKKDKSLSKKEMTKKTMEIYQDGTGGFGDNDEKAYYTEKAEEYADNGQYIFIRDTVDQGSEESIEKVVKLLLKKLSEKDNSLSLEWEDC